MICNYNLSDSSFVGMARPGYYNFSREGRKAARFKLLKVYFSRLIGKEPLKQFLATDYTD
jgi:hypothetical protein